MFIKCKVVSGTEGDNNYELMKAHTFIHQPSEFLLFIRQCAKDTAGIQNEMKWNHSLQETQCHTEDSEQLYNDGVNSARQSMASRFRVRLGVQSDEVVCTQTCMFEKMKSEGIQSVSLE